MKKVLLNISIGLLVVYGCLREQFRYSDLPKNELVDSIIQAVTDSVNLTRIDSNVLNRSFAIFDSMPSLSVSTCKELGNRPPKDGCLYIDILKGKDFYLDNKPIFSTIDSCFIRYQISSHKNYFFNKSLYPNILFIKDSDIKSKRDKMRNGNSGINFWWIRLYAPLVSHQKNYAIVYTEANCAGADCGFGYLVLLKRFNQKWIVIKMISMYQA